MSPELAACSRTNKEADLIGQSLLWDLRAEAPMQESIKSD